MEDVKRYYMMESAVKPMADGAPCCTPLVNSKTDLHIVPLVMGSDYDALRAENAELVAALEFVAAKVKSSGRCHPGAVQYLLAEGLEAVDAALVKKELSE